MGAQKNHINACLHLSQEFGAEVSGSAGMVLYAMGTWYFDLFYVIQNFLWCRMFANDALLGFPTRLYSSCWKRLLNFAYRRRASTQIFPCAIALPLSR